MIECIEELQDALDRRWPGRFRATVDDLDRYQIEDGELIFITFADRLPGQVVRELRQVLIDDGVRAKAEARPGREKYKLN